MSYGYIYKIQFPNGKYYIGLTTTSLKQRTTEHKKCAKQGDTRCLYTALRKYEMTDTLELIEIDRADTLEELCELEIKYIKEYNSYYANGNGYNMTYGGEGINGYIHTEDIKQRMREITKKYYENTEARKKQSEKIKKYFENPEARQQMSKIKKKYYEDNLEARQKLSEALKKYYENNLEARQEASEKTKKYFQNNPEARHQASEKSIKQFKNLEARQKHSEIKKKFFEDNPNAGKEHSIRMKKYYEKNPEVIQKNSEMRKKYYEENPEARKKLVGKDNNKPFDIFTSDGTFIKTFSYQFEAREYLQKEHNITSTIKISEVLTGRRDSSAGFIFRYK
jgi:hypothetical protein